MKCIVPWSRKFGLFLDQVERVTDEEAAAKVKTEDYAYVPKHVWKKYRRD